jgi:hypothetical protein
MSSQSKSHPDSSQPGPDSNPHCYPLSASRIPLPATRYPLPATRYFRNFTSAEFTFSAWVQSIPCGPPATTTIRLPVTAS